MKKFVYSLVKKRKGAEALHVHVAVSLKKTISDQINFMTPG